MRFEIDGKPLDLNNLIGVTIRQGGYIEKRENGVATEVVHHHSWCESLNVLLTSKPPQPAKCNCKGNA